MERGILQAMVVIGLNPDGQAPVARHLDDRFGTKKLRRGRSVGKRFDLVDNGPGIFLPFLGVKFHNVRTVPLNHKLTSKLVGVGTNNVHPERLLHAACAWRIKLQNAAPGWLVGLGVNCDLGALNRLNVSAFNALKRCRQAGPDSLFLNVIWVFEVVLNRQHHGRGPHIQLELPRLGVSPLEEILDRVCP